MAEATSTVLIVDDQDSIRMSLAAVLEDSGYNIIEAESGYQAIDAVKQSSIDLVLLDIKMPGINGVQTFREIKKISPGTAVVMMTGFALEDLVEAALEEGAYSVVYKPFDVEKIISLVESVIKSVVILVVDDHSSDRETLSLILKEKGYRVAEAAGGREAVDMVRSSRFDTILMDVKMPGMDGLTAFEEIKAIDPEAKVVFITGFSDDDKLRQALAKDTFAVINKPFDVEALLMLLAHTTA